MPSIDDVLITDAVAAGLEQRQTRANAVEDSVHVDIEEPVMIGQVDLVDAHRPDAKAGIVDEDVEAPEALPDRAHRVEPLVVDRDVEVDVLRRVTDLMDHGLAGVVVDVGDDDPCTLRCEQRRLGFALATGTPGDQRDLAPKSVCHDLCLSETC